MTSNKLESLRRGNAAKPYQSQLVPHLAFIERLRASRVPYAKIADELNTHAGIKVAPSSIHSFVKARSRKRDVYTILPAVTASPPTPESHTSANANANDPIERLKSEAARSATDTGADWAFYDAKRPLQKLSHQK